VEKKPENELKFSIDFEKLYFEKLSFELQMKKFVIYDLFEEKKKI